LNDIDVCFCYSTAFSTFGGPYLAQLSYTLGHSLKPGSRVITVDKMLVSDGPWEFQLLHSIDGKNEEVGGSTGYIWKVVKSAVV
ncbi:hypothetical protein GUITHDRAFT_65227, partial [Guillardia theta CCMP2712]